MAKKKKISQELYNSLVSNQKVQTNSNNVKKISQSDYSSLVSTTDRLNRGGTKQNIAPLPSTTISKNEVSNNTQKSFSFDINNKYDDGYKNTGKKIGDYIKDSSLKDSEIFQKDNKFYYYDSNKKQYNEITNKTGYDVKENKNTKKTKQTAPVSEHFTNSKQSNINTTGKFEEPAKTVKAREDKLGLADRLSVDFSGKSDEDKKKMEDQLVQQEKDNSRLTGVANGLKNSGYIKAGAFDDGYQFGDLTKTVGSTILSGFNSIGRGAIGMIEGVGDAINYVVAGAEDKLGLDDLAKTTREFAKRDLVDEITMPSSDAYQDSVLGSKSDSIVESIGGMLPSIALGGMANTTKGATALTSGSMFTSSYGQGVSEAYANGATDEEAQTYGLISGIAETATEMMFGGLGKGSKALGVSKSAIPIDDALAQTVSSKFKSKLAQNLTTAVIKSSGEGFEEVASGILQGIGKKMTFESDKELLDILNDEQLLDQFIGGAVASGIMQTPSLVKSTKQDRSLATNYTDNEQKVVDNITDSRFNEQLKDNPNMSKKEQNQLRSDLEEQTKADLEQGNLTPTEIQNALGNDDYQVYQQESQRKQDLEKQLKELQNKSTTDMNYSEYNENNQKIADLQSEINSIDLDSLKRNVDTPVESKIQDNDYLLQRSYNNYQNNQAQKNVAFTYKPQTDSKGKEVKISDLEKNVYDSASKTMNNTKESHNLADFVSKLSKDTGIQYEFTTSEDLKNRGYNVDNRVINGLNTDDGKILINVDSDSIINRVVGHETTHLFEKTEDYKTLQNEVFEYAKTKGDFDKLKAELTEAYKNVKGANINNELTSELVGQYVFSDTEFVQNLSKHRNIFQKVYDEIKHLYKIATAGSKEARQLEKAKRAFEKVYQNNQAKTDINTKYSLNQKLKQYTDKEIENFKGGKVEVVKTTKEVESFVDKELSIKTSNNKILFGKVSDELANKINKEFGINVNDYGIALKGDNVRKIMKDHGDTQKEAQRGQIAVTKKDFDYIDDIVLEPDNIYVSGQTPSGKPSLTFEKSINNKYTLVEFVSDKNHTLEVQTMYKHKKKNSPTADNTMNSLLLTSETDSGSSSFSIDNVSQLNNNVKSDTSNKQYAPTSKNNTKYSLSKVDNQGNTLTKQQQEYFKDSKVRDENGNLKVLYHGTPNEFTKFSYDFIGSNGTALGKGFYLTDNIDIAEGYTTRDGKQGKVMKLYANITKPMSLKEKTISKDDFKKFIEAVDKKTDNQFLSDYGDIDYEGYNNVLNSALDSYDYSDNDVDLIHDVLNTASLSWKDGFRLLKDTLGYDGVISDNVYIPVLPEQIKNVDNQNPTTNEDIRYSLSQKNNIAPIKTTQNDILAKDVRLENRPIAPLPTNTQTKTQNIQASNNVRDQKTLANLPIREDIKKVNLDKAIKDDSKSVAKAVNNMINSNEMTTEKLPDLKLRKWIETSTESDVVDNKLAVEDMNTLKATYEVKSNKKSLEKANNKINLMGYEKSLDYFNSKLSDDKLPTAEDVIMGERLLQEAIQQNDMVTAKDLIENISIMGTELGQATQALSVIKRLTPEGQLEMLTKVIQRAKAKGNTAYDDVEITPEMVEKILKTYKQDGTWNQSELDDAVESVKQDIADQLKVSAKDKINEWRYLSMLGNAKTHLRNIISNIAMKGTLAVKNATARTLETVIPIETKTKTWRRSTDVVKEFAKQTTEDMKSEITGDSKYNDKVDIERKKTVYKNKVLETVRKFNSNALEAEDWFFSKSAFRNSFEEYLTANGIRTQQDIDNNAEIISKAKAYALNQAEIATFRQYSWIASQIGKIENKNIATKLAVGAILPFKKTPINVAKTGLSYSPLGLIKSVSYDAYQVYNGKMEASQLIDNLSQGLTGTSLLLVGYALAKAGFIQGPGEDDKEGKYDKNLGNTGYSLKIGGNSYSISWLSPIAMP